MTLLIRFTIKKFCYLSNLVPNNKTLAAIKAARCGDLVFVPDVDRFIEKTKRKKLRDFV